MVCATISSEYRTQHEDLGTKALSQPQHVGDVGGGENLDDFPDEASISWL